jgi:hypothetical protein
MFIAYANLPPGIIIENFHFFAIHHAHLRPAAKGHGTKGETGAGALMLLETVTVTFDIMFILQIVGAVCPTAVRKNLPGLDLLLIV